MSSKVRPNGLSILLDKRNWLAIFIGRPDLADNYKKVLSNWKSMVNFILLIIFK